MEKLIYKEIRKLEASATSELLTYMGENVDRDKVLNWFKHYLK